jgi:clan AA aspartic protease
MKSMGLVYAPFVLRNPREADLLPIHVNALVDTGAAVMCIPEHVAIQLHCETIDHREVTLADGSQKLYPYVGPIEVRFDGRGCFTGAMVLGDEIIIGSIPLEDMDLVINPLRRTVTVNPESPNIPRLKVKNLTTAGRSN